MSGYCSLFHKTISDKLFPILGVKLLLPEEVPFRLKKAIGLNQKSRESIENNNLIKFKVLKRPHR